MTSTSNNTKINQNDNYANPKYLVKVASSMMHDMKDATITIGGEMFGTLGSDFVFVKNNRHRGGVNNFKLGLIAMKEGKYRSAIFRFSLAKFFCPNHPLPYYYLGLCYNVIGNVGKCLKNLRIAVFLRPSIMSRLSSLLEVMRLTYPDKISMFIGINSYVTPRERIFINTAIQKSKNGSKILSYLDRYIGTILFAEKIVDFCRPFIKRTKEQFSASLNINGIVDFGRSMIRFVAGKKIGEDGNTKEKKQNRLADSFFKKIKKWL